MTFDTKAFRQALAAFPTGVAVIIANDGVYTSGITVNSFTSVSLDPPLVLWCLAKDSQRYDVFIKAPGFTVSILGTEHEEVSSRLARQGEHRLEGLPLHRTELGVPALAEALAVFECERHGAQDGGDHTILLGRVLRFSRRAGAPLVFHGGRYGALSGF